MFVEMTPEYFFSPNQVSSYPPLPNHFSLSLRYPITVIQFYQILTVSHRFNFMKQRNKEDSV